MHPLLRHPRSLLAYLLAWLLVAVVGGQLWAVPGAVALLLPAALLTGFGALALYPVCRALPLRPARWPTGLGQRALAAALLAAVVLAATWLWNATGTLLGPGSLVALSRSALAALGLLVWALGLGACLSHDALIAQAGLREAAVAEAAAHLLAREMALKALRHQVDPHFLFNCLNSISALTQIDPAAARAMIIDLAQYFRQTLAWGDQPLVQVEQELALLASYLAVERHRLGDRLQLVVDVTPEARAARLPPLLLQDLAENAVKHGIRPLAQAGEIRVTGLRAGDHLVLTLRNPVAADAPRNDSGLGQGLRQLRDRLQAQYRGQATLQVQAGADHFLATLQLPWQP